mmetsp:Transcript_16629/g.40961  ORF Transcript_16629/g.40961 Transcript_16629/m.40961 type:complete len:320 (-) Transcript_16629:402-1361(-)
MAWRHHFCGNPSAARKQQSFSSMTAAAGEAPAPRPRSRSPTARCAARSSASPPARIDRGFGAPVALLLPPPPLPSLSPLLLSPLAAEAETGTRFTPQAWQPAQGPRDASSYCFLHCGHSPRGHIQLSQTPHWRLSPRGCMKVQTGQAHCGAGGFEGGGRAGCCFVSPPPHAEAYGDEAAGAKRSESLARSSRSGADGGALEAEEGGAYSPFTFATSPRSHANRTASASSRSSRARAWAARLWSERRWRRLSPPPLPPTPSPRWPMAAARQSRISAFRVRCGEATSAGVSESRRTRQSGTSATPPASRWTRTRTSTPRAP